MNRFLLAALTLAMTLLVCSSASAATPGCAPRSSGYSAGVVGSAGLVGYWRLGEASGSVACDSSSGARPGSYLGGTRLGLTGGLAGDPDTAAGFDGKGASVAVPNASAYTLGDRFSVEAWVRRGSLSTSANQVIASKQNGSWVLMFNSSNKLVLRRSNVADVAASTRTVADTTGWHHVAATKDGTSVHLYIDGADVTGTTTNQVMADNTMPLAIGQSSTSAYFNGTIDEVALYDRPLTPTQITTHYTTGKGSQPPPPPPPPGCVPRSSVYSAGVVGSAGLVGYWRLGEASGSVACDSSAGARPGSYLGGTRLGLTGGLAGDPDTAAGFDGVGASVAVPNASAFTLGDRFSVEAWVRRGSLSTSANQVIASKQNGSWVLMFNSSNKLVLRRSNVGDVAASTRTVADTTGWHHVAATKDGTSVRLYIDGADVTGTTTNQVMADNTMPLAIGQSSTSAYFNGTIDEVALYDRPLTPTQITTHYTTGTAPVIGVAGDIACASSNLAFNGGLGTATECRQKATSDLLVNSGLSAVLPLGDNQYDSGTLAEFTGSYDKSWGRLSSIARPVPGNHEYYTPGAAGYYDYFNGAGNATGRAGDRTKGYYSYDIGTWHLIALNSNCSSVKCSAGSPQETWLRTDLAAHPNPCTLAYWHHPRFNSGYTGNAPETGPLWQALYDAGADVVLAGHSHSYERFAPQTPAGTVDQARGVREFVVGTGGEDHHALGTVQPNSEVRDTDTFGVMRLALGATSYSWQFQPEAGKSFTDSGTAACH